MFGKVPDDTSSNCGCHPPRIVRRDNRYDGADGHVDATKTPKMLIKGDHVPLSSARPSPRFC